MHQKLIHWLAKEEDLVVPTLFKPVQYSIIKKLDKNKKLTVNEKRYLRGKLKDKIQILKEIMNTETTEDEYTLLLNTLDSYYITGPEALKHNGYGWYYRSKIIEVINTKIEGKLALKDKTIKFIRVKSITNSKTTIKSGLKYATNEQIIKDTSFTKNKYTKTLWMQMFTRYKDMFAKCMFKFPKQKSVDYSKYGV